MIIDFCKQHRSRWDKSSHLDLSCLTFSLSTLYINFFPSNSLFKKKQNKKKKKKKKKKTTTKKQTTWQRKHKHKSPLWCSVFELSRYIRKRTFGYVRPAKIQISLHIRKVSSCWQRRLIRYGDAQDDTVNLQRRPLTYREGLWILAIQLNLQFPITLSTGNTSVDQIAQMRRLIWVLIVILYGKSFFRVTSHKLRGIRKWHYRL